MMRQPAWKFGNGGGDLEHESFSQQLISRAGRGRLFVSAALCRHQHWFAGLTGFAFSCLMQT